MQSFVTARLPIHDRGPLMQCTFRQFTISQCHDEKNDLMYHAVHRFGNDMKIDRYDECVKCETINLQLIMTL